MYVIYVYMYVIYTRRRWRPAALEPAASPGRTRDRAPQRRWGPALPVGRRKI